MKVLPIGLHSVDAKKPFQLANLIRTKESIGAVKNQQWEDLIKV